MRATPDSPPQNSSSGHAPRCAMPPSERPPSAPYDQAQRYYRATLELWPEDDPEWPALVVASADVSGVSPPGGHVPARLETARDRLVASGDFGKAAEADMLIAFRFWNEGATEQSTAALSRSGELVERAEPSPTVARVISRLAMLRMVRGQFDEAIELCERALRIVADLHLDDHRPHLLNTMGAARVGRGDIGGIADLEESIEIAERLNSADGIIRGCKNLASVLAADLGELDRAEELQHRGLEAARRFGAEFQIMWFEAELGINAYWTGDWDAADRAFARLDARVADVGHHYMEAATHSCRAKLRTARGDTVGARADIESALAFSRRSADPQMLLPTLAEAALCAATAPGTNSRQAVAELFAELAAATAGDPAYGYWTIQTALALALTDQPLAFAVDIPHDPSLWAGVLRSMSEGRFAEAADALGAIGAKPDEALARLLVARSHAQHGRRAEAELALQPALAFWKDVGAVACLDMAAALLAKTA